MTVPEWLKSRDGNLRPGVGADTVFVMIAGEPQYRLNARPAGGRFACNVTQTVSGRPLGDATEYDTADAAFAGGLERLRNVLGW